MTIRHLTKPSILSISEWPSLAKAAALTILLIALISAIGIGLIGHTLHQQLLFEETENLEQITQLEATRLVGALDRKVAEMQHFAAALSATLSEDGSGRASLNAFRDGSAGIEAAAIVLDNGEVLTTFPDLPVNQPFDRSKWVWFDEAQREPFIMAMLADDGLTRISGVQIAVPVLDANGARIAVVYAV